MRSVLVQLLRVADAEATVLLQGESGTGKGVLARVLHDRSPRSGGPFVEVNCAALPEGVLESELFGHEKGAFTGAVRQRQGRLEQARGGTMFLDEVGASDSRVQLRLLRVLQERRYERVGGDHTMTADVRVVAATNVDLAAEVRRGRFREDLFYRLHVIPVELPPLRDRREDVPLLVQYFLGRQRSGVPPRFPRALSAPPSGHSAARSAGTGCGAYQNHVSLNKRGQNRRLVKGCTGAIATTQLYGAQSCAPDREKAAPQGGFCNWVT